MVDDFSRECLALVVDRSLTGRRVACELDRIAALRSLPLMIVSDNGTEHGADLAGDPRLAGGAWRCLALHRHGQADAERLLESLIGRLRDECPNKHLFMSLPAARHVLELWRLDYNTQGPHTSLDG